ncbi:MAG: antitoxin component YwqK of YwqJK toxin-antitoxin module, partial [Arenicella sp.]
RIYEEGRKKSELTFNSDGSRKRYEEFDEEGEMNGFQMTYHNGNNTIKKQQHFAHGIEDGEKIENYKSGNAKVVWSEKKGDGRMYAGYFDFVSEFNLKEETNYVNGKKEGRSIQYHKDGKIKMDGNFIKGKKDGKFEWYQGKSVLSQIEHYSKGQKNGLFEKYYDDGKVSGRVSYVENKKEGLEESFHRNGELKESTNFLGGKKSGEYFHYDDEGIVKSKGQYSDGMRQGDWIKNGKKVVFINNVEQ